MNNNYGGIYKITNTSNGMFYIGQATNFHTRKIRHFWALRKNVHDNRYLQNVFNKYGYDNITFSVILICEPSELSYYEQVLINKLKPEYNLCVLCAKTRLGLKNTENSNRKLSEYRKGRPMSEEQKYKLSIAHKGKAISEEQKIKLSKSGMGHTVSEETRRKLSNKSKGNTNMVGKHHSEETKRRLSVMQHDYQQRKHLTRVQEVSHD